MPTAAKKSLYSLHPGYAMEATSMVNLQKRTGKTLEEWIKMKTLSSRNRTLTEKSLYFRESSTSVSHLSFLVVVCPRWDMYRMN